MPETIHSGGQRSEFQRLVYTLFQGRPDGKRRSTCVVFTSALPGEGVSHVVREIGLQLAKHQNKRTLIADSAHLESLGTGDLDFIEEAARQKYLAGDTETDGSILIHSGELAKSRAARK